jgi:hypothetical protein
MQEGNVPLEPPTAWDWLVEEDMLIELFGLVIV